MTYFGIAFGAAVGAIGGYGIINPGTVSFGIGIDTPYLSLGTSIGVIGSGTDWNFDFHWTTAAGDGGSIKQIKGEKKLEEELNSFRNNARINYSAYSYAASSLAVLNDDWMGIGVYDDVIIPVVYGVATYNFYQDNKELFGKMWSEAEGILSKHRRENSGFVYELHPREVGMYKNYRTGLEEQLGPNDVWKIGQTTHGIDRYPKESYEFKNFQMVPVYWGTTTELLITEKIYLYSYAFQHGHLPPGNMIFK